MVPGSGLELSAARARIAAAVLASLPDARLGAVRLWPEQQRIVARARRSIAAHGGCIVAEEVGGGKTYIGLALAREWARPLIVAPAALRTTWKAAMARARVAGTFVSHESLSRGRAPPDADGILVDESHHFRNMATRRYEVLAAATAGVPLVLLSATPLQNRRRDLIVQAALFLGESAFALDEAALTRLLVRGSGPSHLRMPAVRTPEWVMVSVNDGRVLRAILDLPSPPRPLDGGDGGALRTIALVRAWASSRAALEAALRARLRAATAIEQGVEAGRAPTKRELRSWFGAEDVVQLGFASLLMDTSVQQKDRVALRASVDLEHESIRHLQSLLRRTRDPDAARVAALREIRSRHHGERILVFSERAATIAAVYAALSRDPGVGMLTARDARIASGRLSRDELLARFAPRSQHARASQARDSVTLLLATDVLSEGMNLQDASVVVHLDLPWNPARLAQRLGRIRRPGGRGEVATYLLAPPADTAALVDAERRLRRKALEAQTMIGEMLPVLPPLAPSSSHVFSGAPIAPRDDASTFGRALRILESWRVAGVSGDECGPLLTAGIEAPATGWLAALSDGRLVCLVDGEVTERASALLRAAEFVDRSRQCVPTGEQVSAALDTVQRRAASEHLATTCGLAVSDGMLRRRVRRWLASAIAAAPRHERPLLFAGAAHIRDALAGTLSLGTERRLAGIVAGAGGTLDRMQACVDALDEATQHRRATAAGGAVRAVALVIFVPK